MLPRNMSSMSVRTSVIPFYYGSGSAKAKSYGSYSSGSGSGSATLRQNVRNFFFFKSNFTAIFCIKPF